MKSLFTSLSQLTEPGHMLDLSKYGEGPRVGVMLVKPTRTSSSASETTQVLAGKQSAVGEALEANMFSALSTLTRQSTASSDSSASGKVLLDRCVKR